jgi:hypothetical protein
VGKKVEGRVDEGKDGYDDVKVFKEGDIRRGGIGGSDICNMRGVWRIGE